MADSSIAVEPSSMSAQPTACETDRHPPAAGDAMCDSAELAVAKAVEFISDQRLLQPQVAIILGSGLGDLANDVQHATAIAYDQIPYFQTTHAVGHAGQLILGFLSGIPVVVMQGRYHRYEGHAQDTVAFPVRVMAALGAKTLIVTNAAGGLNPRYRAGDLMLVDQHINCLWPRTQQIGSVEDAASNPRPAHSSWPLRQLNEVYDRTLLERAQRVARNFDIVHHRGTYIATLGPTYETRAEYRMFRSMGGDAVGMSTVPEVMMARQNAMRVLAISVVTNVACTDQIKGTSHEEVVECGLQVGPHLRGIVRQLLEDMAGPAD